MIEAKHSRRSFLKAATALGAVVMAPGLVQGQEKKPKLPSQPAPLRPQTLPHNYKPQQPHGRQLIMKADPNPRPKEEKPAYPEWPILDFLAGYIPGAASSGFNLVGKVHQRANEACESEGKTPPFSGESGDVLTGKPHRSSHIAPALLSAFFTARTHQLGPTHLPKPSQRLPIYALQGFATGAMTFAFDLVERYIGYGSKLFARDYKKS